MSPDEERIQKIQDLIKEKEDKRAPMLEVLELLWPGVPEPDACALWRSFKFRMKQQGVPIRSTRSTLGLDTKHVWFSETSEPVKKSRVKVKEFKEWDGKLYIISRAGVLYLVDGSRLLPVVEE